MAKLGLPSLRCTVPRQNPKSQVSSGGASWPRAKSTPSARVTAAARPAGEVRPPGIAKLSATTKPELAKSSGEAGSPWSRVAGKNSSAASADAMPTDEARLRERFKQLWYVPQTRELMVKEWKVGRRRVLLFEGIRG